MIILITVSVSSNNVQQSINVRKFCVRSDVMNLSNNVRSDFVNVFHTMNAMHRVSPCPKMEAMMQPFENQIPQVESGDTIDA